MRMIVYRIMEKDGSSDIVAIKSTEREQTEQRWRRLGITFYWLYDYEPIPWLHDTAKLPPPKPEPTTEPEPNPKKKSFWDRIRGK